MLTTAEEIDGLRKYSKKEAIENREQFFILYIAQKRWQSYPILLNARICDFNCTF